MPWRSFVRFIDIADSGIKIKKKLFRVLFLLFSAITTITTTNTATTNKNIKKTLSHSLLAFPLTRYSTAYFNSYTIPQHKHYNFIPRNLSFNVFWKAYLFPLKIHYKMNFVICQVDLDKLFDDFLHAKLDYY